MLLIPVHSGYTIILIYSARLTFKDIKTSLMLQKRGYNQKGFHTPDELLVNHAQRILNHFEKNRQLKWQKEASENIRHT